MCYQRDKLRGPRQLRQSPLSFMSFIVFFFFYLSNNNMSDIIYFEYKYKYTKREKIKYFREDYFVIVRVRSFFNEYH